MHRMRFLAFALVSFIAALIGAFLAPGTLFNRALATALCTLLSLNTTVCTVNAVQVSDRVVAASAPNIETTISNISSYLQAQAPGGTGRFCNVQDPNGGWWLWVTGDMTSDPCQVLLSQHCTGSECRVVSRGTFPLNGQNEASVNCQGYSNTFVGTGAKPLGQAFDSVVPFRPFCTFQVRSVPASNYATAQRTSGSSSNPSATTETQLFGFKDSGSGKVTLRFLDAGDCINNYEITRTTDGYPYAQSITRAIPIEDRCTESSIILTAQVTPDLNEIVLSSNNNALPVKIKGLNSNSWDITYTDRSGSNRTETFQMPLQNNSNSNEQTLQAHKTTSHQGKLNSTNILTAKINCAYMDRQRRNCEQGRRVSEGMKAIINAPVGFSAGGLKFALEKLMELTGNELPKYPKLPPVPQPARLAVTTSGAGLLAIQQIAEGLMSLTCSIAFGDRYNNDFVKFMKEANPNFANWLANTQMYTERRLNEDCKGQSSEETTQPQLPTDVFRVGTVQGAWLCDRKKPEGYGYNEYLHTDDITRGICTVRKRVGSTLTPPLQIDYNIAEAAALCRERLSQYEDPFLREVAGSAFIQVSRSHWNQYREKIWGCFVPCTENIRKKYTCQKFNPEDGPVSN